MKRLLKSTLPIKSPSGGIITSATRDETIFEGRTYDDSDSHIDHVSHNRKFFELSGTDIFLLVASLKILKPAPPRPPTIALQKSPLRDLTHPVDIVSI